MHTIKWKKCKYGPNHHNHKCKRNYEFAYRFRIYFHPFRMGTDNASPFAHCCHIYRLVHSPNDMVHCNDNKTNFQLVFFFFCFVLRCAVLCCGVPSRMKLRLLFIKFSRFFQSFSVVRSYNVLTVWLAIFPLCCPYHSNAVALI